MKGKTAPLYRPFPEYESVPDDLKLLVSTIPYVGVVSDIIDFTNDPTWKNAAYTVTGALLDKWKGIKGIPKVITTTGKTMLDFIINSAQNESNKRKDKD